MRLYTESSAVLAWLLDEPTADLVEPVLQEAEVVFTSDLTLVECDRTLVRLEATGTLSGHEVAQRRKLLEEIALNWTFLRLDQQIVERARQRFPGEPLRSLDALHLASALAVRYGVPKLTVLSLDGRVRRSALDLGFRIEPELSL